MVRKVLPLVLLFTAGAFAQDRSALPEEEWYGELKRKLVINYTGRRVATRIAIPATRRGVQVLDGVIQETEGAAQPQIAAKIGEELIIRSFRIKDNEIEVILSKDESPPKWRLLDLFTADKSPRIWFHFSYELTAKDLTVENMDRLLDLIFELNPPDRADWADRPAADQPIANNQINNQVNNQAGGNGTASAQHQAEARLAEGVAEGVATGRVSSPAAPLTPPLILEVREDLPALGSSIGELSIECVPQEARIYIDGAYSGFVPRTIRLRAGVHSILIVRDGCEPWEKKILVPGAKRSALQAELRRTAK